MSQIRKQSIISTGFVYAGFAIGFINTYLFTRAGSLFTPSEYGLTNTFVVVGNLMFAFANLGTLTAVSKFYPYYQDNLEKKQNDLLTWAFIVNLVGLLFIVIAGIVFKDLVVRKFGEHSPQFVKYYFWIFPFGFSITIYSLLEVFAWNIHKSIVTNFLREVLFRVLTSVLVFLFSFKLINSFDGFIKLYSFTYFILATALGIYLASKKEVHFTLNFSRVTRKFYKKILSLAGLIYMYGIVLMIAQFIDSIIIMSLKGMEALGIFSLGSVVSGLVQAPQRGAVAASTAALSRAWKDKDHDRINRIYQRSGINLLIASLGIFLLIWLNFEDAVITFHLKPQYLTSEWVFFFLGLARVIDLGTGVNSQIISTSNYWRFELTSGVVLLAISTPLNYILVKKFGIVGAGYSAVVAFSIYNTMRIIFLKRKFNMQPFSVKTILALVTAMCSYVLCWYLVGGLHHFIGMVVKSITFLLLYAGGVIYLNLSPDVLPVLKVIRRRMKAISRIFHRQESDGNNKDHRGY